MFSIFLNSGVHEDDRWRWRHCQGHPEDVLCSEEKLSMDTSFCQIICRAYQQWSYQLYLLEIKSKDNFMIIFIVHRLGRVPKLHSENRVRGKGGSEPKVRETYKKYFNNINTFKKTTNGYI